MFKNATIYRIASGWTVTTAALEDALEAGRFVECGATQLRSIGWVEPRGKAHGPLLESIGGQWLLKLMVESKVLPSAVVKRKADERARRIEAQTGRKPGKRESKEIKEAAVLELLPMAFTKQSAVSLWISKDQRLLLVDAGSRARADEVVGFLVKAVGGLSVTLLQTTTSAAVSMAQWLLEREAPAGFSIDRECELKSVDEMKSVVRYSRHLLDTDEVVQHIQAGKVPTRLAMTWQGRVSFVLSESLVLKKIEFLDVVFEGAQHGRDDGFDADCAIATGELGRLLPDLFEALGGETAGPGEATAQQPRLAA